MISYLKGTIKDKRANFIIVDINGMGYKVFIPTSLLTEYSSDQEVEIYTHQHIREDALDLYGFKTLDELELFELMLGISGIGPKSALGVLAIASIDDVKMSIARGDSSLLTKVSGIGKRTAERVVLELKGKISYVGSKDSNGNNIMGDEIDALMALGYSLQEARDALNKIDPKIKGSAERIKAALRMAGK